MGYAQEIFKKGIRDLNINDLTKFFESEQEETSVLEFKSGDVDINDIYKEITAFLNTEGGVLVVGSPNEKKVKFGKNERRVCVGPLRYSSFRSKDWLYQKIASNIVPSPVGLEIFEHIDSYGSVFVIDVPQSTMPPHQCSSDGRYYIRLEREAKPAPHGLVQALFQKRRHPILDAKIKVISEPGDIDKIDISMRNNSDVPADKVSFIVELYNVDNVESGFEVRLVNDEMLGEKFYLTGNANQVLVRVVGMSISLKAKHHKGEYIVFIGYWCKEADFDFKFWTYDPQKKKIICEDRMHYETVSFIEEIERVTKRKIPEKKIE